MPAEQAPAPAIAVVGSTVASVIPTLATHKADMTTVGTSRWPQGDFVGALREGRAGLGAATAKRCGFRTAGAAPWVR